MDNIIDPHAWILILLIYSISITLFCVFTMWRRRKINKTFEEVPIEVNIAKSSRNDNVDLGLELTKAESKINELNKKLTEQGDENRKLKARIKELEEQLDDNNKINNKSGEQEEDRSQSQTTIKTLRKFYAGPYNNDANSFYSVYDVPTEKSLFILSVNSNNDLEAKVEIYPDAIDKILGCKDLLDGVCDYSGSGNVLIMERKGKAILKDIDWRIEEKIIIKFVEK